MQRTFSPVVITRYFQTLRNVPWAGQNFPHLRTAELNGYYKALRSLVSLYRVLSRACWELWDLWGLWNKKKIENTDFSFKEFDYEGLEDEGEIAGGEYESQGYNILLSDGETWASLKIDKKDPCERNSWIWKSGFERAVAWFAEHSWKSQHLTGGAVSPEVCE